MRATILIVDAEIEILSRDRSHAAKHRAMTDAVYGQYDVILDNWLHHDLIKFMPGSERRGRPDIVHHALGLLLDSLAYRRGYIDVLVHTRNDELIRFDKHVELPQNYFEYLNLLGHLYTEGHVGSGEGKITIESVSGLEEVLKKIAAEVNIVMTPHGDQKGLEGLLAGFNNQKTCIIFGGFPEGEYRSPAYDLADITVTLGPEWLNINSVTAEILRCLPK
ncbi:MAG: Ribosomal RNA small subunit methyltransferase Nep1 [Methanomassiliicoccales archaeon PtaU1.Bin124]|nr:MAG: Ribosomal RNA small subunit methyltransferase Nep1 [Methanomassiliicoccales archaeon PtaU1.Bin124]